MGIFDKLFKRKKEESDVIGTCMVCNKPIHKNEDYKTISFQGKKYLVHKKCFRKAKKMAKKYISGGLKL